MRARLPLGLLAALLISACGATDEARDAGTHPADQVAGTEEPSDGDAPARGDGSQEPAAGPPPAPGPAPSYEILAAEPAAAVKRAAADLAQALTTYGPDDTPASIVARATDDPELAAQLRAVVGPLVHAGAWSRGEVVYPQLGGLEEDASAVITVVRQRMGNPDGSTTEHTRVLDVRADRGDDGRWRISELASTGGEPVPRPDDLSEAAAAVLDDERIELPDTVRWDVHRGAVDESLLALMARMADRAPYGVVVIRTGHSAEVFGTDPPRPSRHSEGRAVDIYRVGDRHVVEDRERGSGTHDLVRWLYDQPELAGVGSPWALDGFGGRSFSDQLHQDHLHVAVLRPGEDPVPRDLDEQPG